MTGSGTQHYNQDSYQQHQPQQDPNPFDAQSYHSHSQAHYQPSEHQYSAPQQDYDSRSVKSYHTYQTGTSQAHLNKSQYEMSQVNIPPVPALNYQQSLVSPPPTTPYSGGYAQNSYSSAPNGGVVDYPPQQPQYNSVPQRGTYAYPERPMPGREASSAGFSVAREKMMKRRVSGPCPSTADTKVLIRLQLSVHPQDRVAGGEPSSRRRGTLAYRCQWSDKRGDDQDAVYRLHMR